MKHFAMKQLTIALAVLTSLSAGLALVPAQRAEAKNTYDTSTCVYKEFRDGDMNQTCVTYIQKMLNKANNAKLGVDGDYGPLTAAAVKTWQKKVNDTYNGTMYVDGITGEQTWASLCLQRTQYNSIAKTAGCNRWNDEISAFIQAEKKQAREDRQRAKKCVNQTIGQGSKDSVKDSACAHRLIKMLNITQGTDIDDTEPFGLSARKAAEAFQHNSGVQGDATGVVGPNTWKKLCGYNTGNNDTATAYRSLKKKVGC